MEHILPMRISLDILTLNGILIINFYDLFAHGDCCIFLYTVYYTTYEENKKVEPVNQVNWFRKRTSNKEFFPA